jgi:CxxC motif-containing protein (DUF1111 family)
LRGRSRIDFPIRDPDDRDGDGISGRPNRFFDARRGREVFAPIGCDRCHVPALRTRDNPVPALRYRDVAAYTDLLLHDMGPELGDICLGLATPQEFRTEPLMGLRLSPRFLHDGRPATLEAAVELHGGEGLGSPGRTGEDGTSRSLTTAASIPAAYASRRCPARSPRVAA